MKKNDRKVCVTVDKPVIRAICRPSPAPTFSSGRAAGSTDGYLVRWFVVFFNGQPSTWFFMSCSDCYLLGTSPRQPLSSHFIDNLKGFIERTFLTTNNIDICVLYCQSHWSAYQASLQSALGEFFLIFVKIFVKAWTECEHCGNIACNIFNLCHHP